MSGVITWYAIKVAPRAEFRVQGALQRMERPAIMPFGERSVERENRPKLRRWRKYPLIPGYVFGGFFGIQDFAAARMAINAPLEHSGQPRDVVGLVGFGNTPAILKPADVLMLSTMTDEPPVEEVPFSVGQEVVVYGQKTKVHANHPQRREFDAFVSFLGGTRLVRTSYDTATAA